MQVRSQSWWKVNKIAQYSTPFIVFVLLTTVATSQPMEKRVRSEHFAITVEGKIQPDRLAHFVNACEDRYGTLSSRLPIEIPSEIHLHVFIRKSTGRGAENIFKATDEGITVTIASDWENSSAWRHRFDYFLLRAILAPRIREGCPRWLIEGAALVFSGDTITAVGGTGIETAVGGVLADAGIRHLSDLDEQLLVSGNGPADPDLKYVLVATIQALRSRFGTEAIFTLLQQCQTSDSFDSVARHVLHESLAELESWWRAVIFQKP
ncbi:MAG: hypothetical protein ACP5JH_03750 [Bacteroidota bacterium]